MQIPFEQIDKLRPSKCQDIYKINFENNVDYKKVKYLLSRLSIRWSANDFTKTIYFCGKQFTPYREFTKALGVDDVSKSKESSAS